MYAMTTFEYLLPLDARFKQLKQETTATQLHLYFDSHASSAYCPKCRNISTHRHSRTKRTIRDLPIAGKEVFLHIRLQKWFCRHGLCNTTIFTETIDAAPAYQRNTVRVNESLREIAFRTNCVQAAKLSTKLGLPVSHDTLLRLIYQTPQIAVPSPFPCD